MYVCMYVCPNDKPNGGGRLARSAGPSSAKREPVERGARVPRVLNARTSNKESEFAECEARDSRARSTRPLSATREFKPQLPISPL